MEHKVFFDEDFSADYSKLSIEYSVPFHERILSYLYKKKEKQLELAVDVGCGTGRSTRVLAPYFKKVIGTDISETQINQALANPSPDNISYIVCSVEALELEDNSVDLVTAVFAAHWFEMELFLKEVNRVLKPGGCLALLSARPPFEFHYNVCSDKLNFVFQETIDVLMCYLSEKVKKHICNQYEEYYNAIPYKDKERIIDVLIKQKMTMRGAMDVLRASPMYHSLKSKNPLLAEELIQKTEQRFRDILQESFDHAVMDVSIPHYWVLACKPNPLPLTEQRE